MQHRILLSFRKRLKNRGYRDVSICKSEKEGFYIVKAVEPLTNIVVSAEYSLVIFDKLMR